MIIEPVMMNIGLIPPPPGYLESLRDLLHRHGAYLAFDEVKTGLGLAPGGAIELVGRGAGPRLPRQGARRRRAVRRDRRHPGTHGAHRHRCVRTGRHIQRQPVDDGRRPRRAHRDPDRRRVHPLHDAAHHDGRRRDRHPASLRLPGHVRSFGAKGAVIFHDRLANYRDFLDYPDQWGNAHWLYQHNGGVFLPPWGKCEQWTVSVQHSVDDVRVFLTNLERLAQDLAAAREQPR
jgi:glutamate-1-semialdehyde 2,1-aminomutase